MNRAPRNLGRFPLRLGSLRVLCLLPFLACTTSDHEPEADIEPTQGAEEPTTRSDQDDRELVALMGDELPPDQTIEQTHRVEREQREREQREREQHESTQRAEFEATCASVAISSTLPPAPPPTRTGTLPTVEATYQAALAPPPPPPANGTLSDFNDWASSTLADWIADSSARMSALERSAGALTNPDERAIGAAWLAHAYASLAYSLDALPAPGAIRNDPDLLNVYRRGFRDPLLAVLEKAIEALAAAPPRNPNWSHYTQRLDEWLRGTRCAFHPGR